jgi:transcriptional regulator with PAS, ATPase and Fis domain
VLVCDSDTLESRHLPSRFSLHPTPEQHSISFKLGTPLKDIEREMILHALAATNNNRKRAAELLGISRRAIYNKIEKYNL